MRSRCFICSCTDVAVAPYGIDPLDLLNACREILESEVGERQQQQQQQPQFQLDNEARKNRSKGSSIALAIGGLLLKLLHPDLMQESAAELLCTAYTRVTGMNRKFPNTTFRRRTKEYMAHFTDSKCSEEITGTYGMLSANGWSQLKYVLPYLTVLSIIDLQREHHYRNSKTVDRNEVFVQVADIFLHSLAIIDQRNRTSHSPELQNVRYAGLLELPLTPRLPLEPTILEAHQIPVSEAEMSASMEQAFTPNQAPMVDLGLIVGSGTVESQSELDHHLLQFTAISDHLLNASDSLPFDDMDIGDFGSTLNEENSWSRDTFQEASPQSTSPPQAESGVQNYITENAHHLNAIKTS